MAHRFRTYTQRSVQFQESIDDDDEAGDMPYESPSTALLQGENNRLYTEDSESGIVSASLTSRASGNESKLFFY